MPRCSPVVDAAVRSRFRLPVSICARAAGAPPLRVITCTTPPIASEPYTALWGPRTTSMRSTSSSGTCDRSMPPPNALARTPSIMTRVKSDSPPRVNSDVTVPGPPFCWTVMPGTDRNAVESMNCCFASISMPSITVTLSGVRDRGWSTCDADTTSVSFSALRRSVMSSWTGVVPIATDWASLTRPGPVTTTV